MNFDYQTLKLQLQEHIAFLSVNRPDKLNALNQEVLSELKDFFEKKMPELEQCRGVLFFGEGDKAFIAGADIAAMKSMPASEARDFAQLGQEVSLLIEQCRVPVIAAVDGFALGGGCEMAMSCDMIYATEKSVFGQPEINLGLIPGFGGTQRLGRYIGRARAKEMIYTGRNIKAPQALEWGLVSHLFENGELMREQAVKALQQIATKSPLIVAKCKSAINEGEGLHLRDGLEVERQGFMSVFETQDSREGMSAFLEKRAPNFKGS